MVSAPIADNQNALTAGRRGPVLMQYYQLLEKLAHQNRERIAERVVHAKGSLKNNFTFWMSIHPAGLRCGSSEYA